MFCFQQLNNTQNSSSVLIICNFHFLDGLHFIIKTWIENHMVNKTRTSNTEPNSLYQRKLRNNNKKTEKEWILFIILKIFTIIMELSKNNGLKSCFWGPFQEGLINKSIRKLSLSYRLAFYTNLNNCSVMTGMDRTESVKSKYSSPLLAFYFKSSVSSRSYKTLTQWLTLLNLWDV